MRSDLTVELRDLLMSLQRELKPTVSIEVGAWKAEFSHRMRELDPDMRCWAFEANPYNYVEGAHPAFRNNINYINMAMSNRVGKIEFLLQNALVSGEVFPKEMGNNSILARNDNVTLYEKVQVDCSALDHFFVTEGVLSPQDLICLWIDVEGASREVLTSGRKVLEQTQTVFIEVEDVPYWQDQWLAGDVDKFLKENNFVKVARDYEYPLQNNVIYLKQELLENDEIRKILDDWNTAHGNL